MNARGTAISRRKLLYLAGVGGATIALGSACGTDAELAPQATTHSDTNVAAPDCVLTPEGIEGPFYTDVNLVRGDISEGKDGTPLELRLTVVDANTCEPIPDASIDVWHADAGGLYSAFEEQGDDRNIDTTRQTFLRGVQNTNDAGLAVMKTVYPGWYMGRTTHIHIKIHFANQTRVTTQLFFPDEISTAVYKGAAYSARGEKDTPNERDAFSGAVGSLRMTVEPSGGGYTARHTLGIQRT